jgi:hypothetical protein
VGCGAVKPLTGDFSRKVYIRKAGKQRLLGIAAFEDKIVQQAVVTVLTPVYEAGFLGSFGFPPGRNQHPRWTPWWSGCRRSA